jgi:tetratricopeptide (TPR) repeat protein
MWAAVRWSWDLLTPVGQRGLAQLSVFRGGFDLESAVAVLELAIAEDGKPVDAVAVLEFLVDNSTVEAVRDGGAPRFKLLLPIREFANQQLSGRERSGVWARYTAFFLDRARAARARHGERDPENLRFLDADLAELLQIADEARDPSCRAEAIWFLRPGLLQWGQRQRLARMLDTIDLDALEGDLQPAMAICLARSLVVRVRFAEAVALLERFRESAGAHVVWLHTSLAFAHLRGGDLDAAERNGTEAFALLEAPVGPEAAAILGKLGVIARRRNELDLAHVRMEEALGALRGRDHIETARCHLRLGYLEHALGRYARSHTSFSRSIEIADRLDERDMVHLASCARALLTYETDGLDAALPTCASLVENGRRMGLPAAGASLCLALAIRAVGEDRIATAQQLVGECRGLFPADIPPRVAAHLTVTEAIAMHWEGRLTEAVAGYRAGLDALSAVDEYSRQQMLPYGIVALVQAGDLAQGRAWLEDIEPPHESAAQCLAIVRAFVEGEKLPESSEVAFGERVLRRLIAGA